MKNNITKSLENIGELLRVGLGLEDDEVEVAKNILKQELEKAREAGFEEAVETLNAIGKTVRKIDKKLKKEKK